ncbi:DUF1667 domain-containing protein [Deferribacterales bacterium RsTz2092]|nr:molybdopterin oxidoreductase [Deferribacterales bacterium]
MTELTCVCCPIGCLLQVDEANGYLVSGNKCPRGLAYGKKELTNPTRVITSTVWLKGGDIARLPVKTDAEIAKGQILEAVKLLDGVSVQAPVKVGDVVLSNVLGSEVNFVATRHIN